MKTEKPSQCWIKGDRVFWMEPSETIGKTRHMVEYSALEAKDAEIEVLSGRCKALEAQSGDWKFLCKETQGLNSFLANEVKFFQSQLATATKALKDITPFSCADDCKDGDPCTKCRGEKALDELQKAEEK